MVKHKKKLWGTFLLLFLVVSSANAQSKQNHLYKSGYGDVPRFGGPSSVGGTLEEDDREELGHSLDHALADARRLVASIEGLLSRKE